MSKEYEFHQSSTSVSSNLQSAAKLFNKQDLPHELIQAYNAVKMNDVEKTKALPQVSIDLLKEIQPNHFLQEIDALQHPKNDTGIENSYVFKRFWQSTSIDDQILIINPHITFIRMCKYNLHRVVVTYTNEDMVTALSLMKGSNKYHPTTIDELSKSRKFSCVLYFVRDSNPEEVILTLNAVRPYLLSNNAKINVLLPNAYLDRNNNQNELRKYLFSQCTVSHITLFDECATNIAPIKKCFLSLSPVVTEPLPKISAEYAKFLRTEHKKMLIVDQCCEIDYAFLRDTPVTLHAAFKAALTPQPSAKRNPPVKYQYSNEITVFCSPFESERGWRAKYSIHEDPTREQLLRNPLTNGKIIGKCIWGKQLDTKSDVVPFAEEIVLSSRPFSEIICKYFKDKYMGKPISLKTLWYVYLDTLKETTEYDHEVCFSVFHRINSADNDICALIVGVSNINDIADAVKCYVNANALSHADEMRIWEQLELLYDLAVKMKHAKENPVIERNEEMNDEFNRYHTMRYNLVIPSYNGSVVEKLINTAIDYDAPLSFIIGFLLGAFEGMLSGVICALKWRDYKKVTNVNLHYLDLHCTFGPTGFEAKPFKKSTQYRYIPIVSVIDELLKKLKRESIATIKAMSLTDVRIEDCPILHDADDPRKPISARSLNVFCSQIMTSEGYQEHLLSFDKDGYEETTDINHKRSNMLQSNFEYHAAKYARLTPDEIAYLKGNKRSTTKGNNYCGFDSPHGLEELAIKLENWVSRYFNAPIDCVLSESNSPLEGRNIAFTNVNAPSEIKIDISADARSGEWVELTVSCQYGVDIIVDPVKGVKFK